MQRKEGDEVMKSSRWPALIVILGAVLTVGAVVHADSPLPWEDPNSGFEATEGGKTADSDKIEAVINTSGGQKEDGPVTGSEGSADQKAFVDGFLNEKADKIKAAGGGTGWVYTWKKKWKIGPDGKPYEVVEKWHKGNIGGEADPKAEPGATPGTTPTTPATPGTPKSPDGSTTTTTTAATPPAPGTSPAAPPASGPGASPKDKPVPPKAVADMPAGTVVPKGPSGPTNADAPDMPTTVAIAPPLLAPAEIMLTVQNPLTHNEEAFGTNVFPNMATPTYRPRYSKLSKAVPEDTRVKIALQLGSGINPDDVTLMITDSNGEQPPVAKAYYEQYRHLFRIPDNDRYCARVLYKHPHDPDPDPKEVLRLIIPVHALDFRNRTIDAYQSRVE